MSAREPRLGVDIGRVIVAGDGPDTSFLNAPDDEALRAPAMPGAVEALSRLRERFQGRVWLVSKCGPRIQQRTRAWLAHHRFFEVTGIDPTHLKFCLRRAEKAPICARLGITCFVDDRLDVLVAMARIVETRLLFGATSSPVAGIEPVPTWEVARVRIWRHTEETAS
jgi:hypothetical protein